MFVRVPARIVRRVRDEQQNDAGRPVPWLRNRPSGVAHYFGNTGSKRARFREDCPEGSKILWSGPGAKASLKGRGRGNAAGAAPAGATAQLLGRNSESAQIGPLKLTCG
ncbi:hypothetical protein GCM10023081_01930 [Arthrobacter ginkgonis]|uniref:Uncharacterized protein n=1 Tax=Arthrobacter ginkgonis TaxID=1630594 RepID=A0ABP7BSH1_9MICC